MTLGAGLGMLWAPIVQGVLQGRQRFDWLGGTLIFNGAGRLGISAVAVACGAGAAGVMGGAFIGLAAAVGVGLWLTRDLWRGERSGFQWQPWLQTVVPLTAACGTTSFMMTLDTATVVAHLHDTAPYIFGATLARSVVYLALALVAVMFPKIVQSAVLGRRTNVLTVTLLCTLALGVAAAEGLQWGGALAVRILAKPEYTSFLPLIHRYTLAVLPLTLANVLIGDMLARGQFRAVPWVVVVGIAYWLALQRFHDSFGTVILVMGCANLTLLATCWLLRQAGGGRPQAAPGQ
jgi:hypothetical protein